MEPTTPQIDSSELIAQNQSDNRPRQGKPGYSPNANYSGKSRHKPNIPSAHNTKPYDIVHEVPVPREEVSVQMPNSIYDSLGYFKLKDNCLQNTLN